MKNIVLIATVLGTVLFGAVTPGTASAYPPETTTTLPPVTETTLPNTGGSGIPGGGAPTTTLPGGGVLPDTGGGSGVLPDTGGGSGTGGALPRTGSDGISTSLTIGGVALLVGIGLLVVAGIRRRNAATPSPA